MNNSGIYEVTFRYQTPLGNQGSFHWENWAHDHNDALNKAETALKQDRRYRVQRALDGEAYLKRADAQAA